MEALDQALGAGNELKGRSRTLIERLFERYRRCFGRPDLVRKSRYFSGAPGEPIKTAYRQTYEGGRIYEVRQSLQKLVGNRCPSCGGSRPTQLDHHLAKTDYPEFSVLPINLVPYCGGCNGKKSDRQVTDPEKAFIHPYLDAVPDVPYLMVTIQQNASVTVQVAFDPNVVLGSDLLRKRMAHQFATVDVPTQLKSEIVEFLEEHADNIAGAGLPDGGPVSDYLAKAADRVAGRLGQTFWKVSILRALAADVAFCSGGYKALLKA